MPKLPYKWPLPRGSIPNDFNVIEKRFYNPDKRVPEFLLKNNHLYYIRSRNSNVGIYNYERRSFKIARKGYGDYYLFDEYDLNTGRPYGTAVPFKHIEETPIFKSKQEMLIYLLKWNKDIGDYYLTNPYG